MDIGKLLKTKNEMQQKIIKHILSCIKYIDNLSNSIDNYKVDQRILIGLIKYLKKCKFMPSKKLIEEIVIRIKNSVKPVRIILFGSYASGNIKEDSDVDILVVIDTDKEPQNYEERSENYLKISRELKDIQKKIAIDLLVYTQKEFEKFKSMGSMFSKHILKTGKDLA